MKSETKAGEEFYRKELAAEFARNQALEQQIERLLAEMSRLKGEVVALSGGDRSAVSPVKQPASKTAVQPLDGAVAPAPAASAVVSSTEQMDKPKPRSGSAVPTSAEVPVVPAAATPAAGDAKPGKSVKSAPGKLAAEKTAPEKTAPEKTAPGKSVSGKSVSGKSVLGNTAQLARPLVVKLSRSRVKESRSADKPPCLPDAGAEALFEGTREFIPTEELAQHSWTVALQAQPAGTAFRLRFAVRAVDVPVVSVRLRYADDVQRTLRFQLDFQKGEIRLAGGRLDAEVRVSEVTPLGGGWLLCEFEFVVGRDEPIGFVLVFIDPSVKSPWQMTGRPGQRLVIGAATVSATTSGGTATVFAQADAEATAEEDAPRIRVVRRSAPAAESTPPPPGLAMSERDRAMTPSTVGGRAVTPGRWQKLAEQRLAHERSFADSDEWEKIVAMKDIYKGKRAFILGNGPSINDQDLTLLRDEITFVANWFVNHKRFRRINPKFYCVSSHEMFGGWGKTPELNADFARLISEKQTEQTFFFSNRFATYMRELDIVPDDRLRSLIFDRPKFLIDEIGTQNYELNRCMDDGYTVLLTFCVPLCVHFGITDIYLLGCDCDYGLTAPTDPKAYFYRPEQHTSATTSFDSLVRIWTPGGPIFQSYEVVAREAEVRGTRMWNATRGGRLELLPRVEYESLVSG